MEDEIEEEYEQRAHDARMAEKRRVKQLQSENATLRKRVEELEVWAANCVKAFATTIHEVKGEYADANDCSKVMQFAIDSLPQLTPKAGGE